MILQRLIYAIGAMMLSYILSEVTLDAALKLEQTGKFTFLVKVLAVIHYFSAIGSLLIGLYMRLQKGSDVELSNRINELTKELQKSNSTIDTLRNENKKLKDQLENHTTDSAHKAHYLMESSDGMFVHVPEDKLDDWQAAQEGRGPVPSPEMKKLFREEITKRIYGTPSDKE
jgi:cell division protein FtsB